MHKRCQFIVSTAPSPAPAPIGDGTAHDSYPELRDSFTEACRWFDPHRSNRLRADELRLILEHSQQGRALNDSDLTALVWNLTGAGDSSTDCRGLYLKSFPSTTTTTSNSSSSNLDAGFLHYLMLIN